jgi:hypothetical protein
MDISNALIAKSDQINSIDLVSGPQTVSIIDVVQGNAEQPVNIITDVFGKSRPFKPSKTVLRILAGVWGKETAAWIGHRMTIYRDPSVRWAGEEIGGIRIQALSHIDKPVVFNLPTSKGKHAKSTVTPLAVDAPTAATPAAIPPLDPQILQEWLSVFANAATLTELQAAWKEAGAANVASHPQITAAKDAQKLALSGEVGA